MKPLPLVEVKEMSYDEFIRAHHHSFSKTLWAKLRASKPELASVSWQKFDVIN